MDCCPTHLFGQKAFDQFRLFAQQVIRCIAWLAICASLPPFAWSQPPTLPTTSGSASVVALPQRATPRTDAYDEFVASYAAAADLNSLAIVSADRMVAVGDRGCILVTSNAGREWALADSPTTADLDAVAFDEGGRGIALGGWIGAATGTSHCVCLLTSDGGKTWEPAEADELPRLTGLHYQAGRAIAWGDYHPAHRTGVYESVDGGKSWRPIQLPLTHVTAATLAPGGVLAVVDRLGRATFGVGKPRQQTLATAQRPLSQLHHTGQRWLACGSHGELIQSLDSVNWTEVPLPLTSEIRQCCDWKAIEQVGNEVWVGGAPGSVLLHSPDAGISWEVRFTNQTLPIADIKFEDSGRGWFVGPLNGVWATRDGGRSWYSQNQAARRLGILSIAESSDTVPWTPLIAAAWDERMAVGSLALRSPEPIEHAGFSISDGARKQAFASQLGVSQHRVWSATDRLVNTSASQQTSLRLTCELLTWRPDVVLLADNAMALSPSTSQPGASASFQTLVKNVVRQAALGGPEALGAALGLKPWSVKKIAAVVDVSAAQYREQSQRTLRTPALSIADLLHPLPLAEQVRVAETPMQTLWARSYSAAASESLLGAIAPAQDWQFDVNLSGLGNYQLVMGRVHRERSLDRLAAEVGRLSSDTQWRKSLDFLLRTLPPHELGTAAQRLAGKLESPGSAARRKFVLQRLVSLQPDSDSADWARLEQLKWLASDEVAAWTAIESRHMQNEQKTHSPEASRSLLTSDPTRAGAYAEENLVAPAALSNVGDGAKPAIWTGSPFSSEMIEADAADAVITPEQYVRSVAANLPEAEQSRVSLGEDSPPSWFLMLTEIYRAAPHLRARPDLLMLTQRQLQLRAKESGQAVESVMQPCLDAQQLVGWPQVARQEELLSLGRTDQLKFITHAAQAKLPPILDGNLTELFWTHGVPMELTRLPSERVPEQTTAPDTNDLPAVVRWAYDAEYLYVAIECPRMGSSPVKSAKPIQSYDSNLQGVDHVSLLLDTDRDYNSAIELAIAEDGATYDRINGQAAFNPKWHVAVKSEETRWTAELAIELPWLTTQQKLSGHAWAVSARRLRPAGASQSWSQLQTHQSLLQGNGLLLFDAEVK